LNYHSADGSVFDVGLVDPLDFGCVALLGEKSDKVWPYIRCDWAA
jgi:hypothetical protein